MKKVFAALSVLIFLFSTVLSNPVKADIIKYSNKIYNSDYMFSFKCPDFITVTHMPDEINPILEMEEKAINLKATISFDKIDQDVMQNIRDYLGDYSSSESDIFEYIVTYKDSFLKALTEKSETDYLYGDNDSFNDPYIKIFKDYKDNLYGVDSYVKLYNSLNNVGNLPGEKTVLNIMVPSYENKIIYTFNFSVEKGKLNSESIISIINIMNSFQIHNHEIHTVLPDVLNDNTAIGYANKGIFPGVDNTEFQYNTYEDKFLGYRIKYPSTFMPYKNSSFMNALQYKSFRITTKDVFSINIRKDDIYGNSMQDYINALVMDKGSKIKISHTGVETIGLRNAIYIDYSGDKGGIPFYVKELLIKNNGNLYIFKLQSDAEKYSCLESDEFTKIVNTLEFFEPAYNNLERKEYMNRYNNEINNVNFHFPSNFELSNQTVGDITYLALKDPSLSSSFKINIYENELTETASYENTLKISIADGNEYKSMFTDDITYLTPNQIVSDFTFSNNTGKILKLENYIDEYGRARLSCKIIILKDKRAYTMLIDISEYSINGMQNLAPGLVSIINSIADSFHVK